MNLMLNTIETMEDSGGELMVKSQLMLNSCSRSLTLVLDCQMRIPRR
jgi:hypothetical protein